MLPFRDLLNFRSVHHTTMSRPQGPPGPDHLYTNTETITREVWYKKGPGDVCATQSFQGYLELVGITPQGYQHLLNNQIVLSHQVANLDTTTMAAAAARDAKEISKKVTTSLLLCSEEGDSGGD